MADKELGAKIVDLRESVDMSQVELGRRIGLEKSAMSKIESGSRKVSSDELKKISDVFDVSTDYLLGKNQAPAWATKKDIIDLEQMIEDNVGMAYKGEELSEKDKQRLDGILTSIYWEKLQNKRKREHQE
ncbi:helix-turn-helix domain-containing protein [Loigolactobacillus bifermentans]|jgi:transcriptional regulator with XRE-family HTH domain|uniref:HTH cro/C1-type domain-containing protein n=1 Tax=Loigolactobacillus bifermentans DSM 20003 TaxID=1423726 RepID=A0A0R1H2Z8_9LACO|nr:helix-turn-helix transcriptional regulator [Loigolactobacillus bifermentans]KRK40848.1 hypothetical protein FC07_GL002600 [Loigolactobacillus bifermentans DSM 20003]QGG59601.1 helix-turn-helix domain-containing protein [Loigolactobacillus bifermentans]